jgi:hypothetical protein
MKALIAFFALLLCAAVHATPPEYLSSRKWVKDRCSTDTTPKDERIFVGRMVPKKYAGIIHFHKGITLREIIDQTPFKGTAVMVCVLRGDRRTLPNVSRVAPSEKPDYEVKNMDMIWLYEDGPFVW